MNAANSPRLQRKPPPVISTFGLRGKNLRNAFTLIELLVDVPGRHGVGIYWQDGGLAGQADWDAKGYKSSVVTDAAGTILLVEDPNIQNVVGNAWPSVCLGPLGAGDLYQVDPSPSAKNFGNNQYGIHGKRFNYLFHDNHVQALKIEQTVGSGTLNTPRGIWTIKPGD